MQPSFIPYPGLPLRIGFIVRATLSISVLLGLVALVVEWIRPTVATGRKRLGPDLRSFVVAQVVFTAVCWAFLFHWRHYPAYPYTTPYLHYNHLLDLEIFRPRFEYLHNARFFDPPDSFLPLTTQVYQYPAADALLYEAFYTTKHPAPAFLLVTVPLLLVLAFSFARALSHTGVARWKAYGLVIYSLVLSYPLWLEIVLGNLELCIFLLVAFGIWSYLKGRPYVAAVLLGIAGGMKLYPLIYLGVFVARRQWKQTLTALVVAVLCNLVGLWLVGPSLHYSFVHVLSGLHEFREHYTRSYLPIETSIDHSAFGLLKRLIWKRYPDGVLPDRDVTLYLISAAAVGIGLYVARIRKLPLVNQIATLCIASIWIMPTSHDYTLLHLYVPCAMLVLLTLDRYRERIQGAIPALLCFAVLFSPTSEFIRHGLGFSGQVKCVALVALMLVFLRWPMRNREEASGLSEAPATFSYGFLRRTGSLRRPGVGVLRIEQQFK